METLPREIIELIFNYCEPKTLAVSIPRVSKLFKKYSEDDSNIWKAKCEQKYSGSSSKLPEQTWKQLYFHTLTLFPFHGFIITKTTHEEMLAQPGAVEKDRGRYNPYVEYASYQFYESDGVFNFVCLNKGSELLPKEWIQQGLSWDISFVELKELLKKKVGNYDMIDRPYQENYGGDNYCFSATIKSAVKEVHGNDTIYYDLGFKFDYTPGTETTPGTLYKICVGEERCTKLYLITVVSCT